MTKIYFCNQGHLDPRAMLTFGVNVKEGQNPIGQFGTGFKYAVAIVLRLGGTFKVHTQDNTFEFICRKETIRGKEFDMVYITNAKEGTCIPASCTTHLGSHWKPWMAFRELYCNAKDEGGEVRADMEALIGFDTIIEVECAEITQAYNDRTQYFLEERKQKPLYADGFGEIYAGSSDNIFYRSIAVAEAAQQGLYTYNLLVKQELSEDRTLANIWSARYYIRNMHQQCTDPEICRMLIGNTDQKSLEHELSFDPDLTCSETFLDVIEARIAAGQYVKHSAREALRKKRSSDVYNDIKLTALQQMILDRASRFIQKALKLDVKRYPIRVVEGLGPQIMGQAHNETILLSPLAFNMGTKQVCSTILEEWVHLDTGSPDFSRAMQNWLFDRILSMGEEALGEPL